jgi:EAL domain-containing protein (putative c-di-GMP-specific phosphodiesterase class I)
MDIQPTPSPYRATDRSPDGFAPTGGVDFAFTFAFQPIVDAATREIISFEALVRGPAGESSDDVFSWVPRENLYHFDQACRLKAIHLARRLNLDTSLNLNFFPNSAHGTGTGIRATLQASLEAGFPVDKLVFEVSESELLQQHARIEGIFDGCQDSGFLTAIDDFGAGYSGLRMLADYQPNFIKLDRDLVSDVHENHVKQIIVRGMRGICRQLSIETIAEGVEKAEEYHWLRKAGIHLFQGFYFARPAFEALAEVPLAVYN